MSKASYLVVVHIQNILKVRLFHFLLVLLVKGALLLHFRTFDFLAARIVLCLCLVTLLDGFVPFRDQFLRKLNVLGGGIVR